MFIGRIWYFFILITKKEDGGPVRIRMNKMSHSALLSPAVKCLLSDSGLSGTGEVKCPRLLLDKTHSLCAVCCAAIGRLHRNRGQWQQLSCACLFRLDLSRTRRRKLRMNSDTFFFLSFPPNYCAKTLKPWKKITCDGAFIDTYSTII